MMNNVASMQFGFSGLDFGLGGVLFHGTRVCMCLCIALY